jgi:hypothetical protein
MDFLLQVGARVQLLYGHAKLPNGGSPHLPTCLHSALFYLLGRYVANRTTRSDLEVINIVIPFLSYKYLLSGP